MLFDFLDRDGAQVFLVDAFCGFFFNEKFEGLFHGHFAGFLFIARKSREHALELFGHVFHAGWRHDVHLRRGLSDFDIDLSGIKVSLAQPFTKGLAGGVFFADR